MMEQITIDIRATGAAFTDAPASEVARILRLLAYAFEHEGGPASQTLRDFNGNACGTVVVGIVETLTGE